jgi:hypothetical protein
LIQGAFELQNNNLILLYWKNSSLFIFWKDLGRKRKFGVIPFSKFSRQFLHVGFRGYKK